MPGGGAALGVLAAAVAVAQQGDPLLAKGIRQVEDAGRPRTATVVVYSDYLCPFSRQFAPRVPGMRAAWGDRVTLEVRNFPLDQACNPAVTRAVHPGACTLALGAICARGQGRFWEYHAMAFSNPPPNASKADALRLAAAAGLDVARFSGCLASPQAGDQLAAEIAGGAAAGVTSTPQLFVNGKKLGLGGVPQATIDRELEAATPESGAALPGAPPRDPGIDTAVVRVPLAALREGASNAARVLFEARQGTVLALVSREASGGFYRVIEIESGKQGFVRAEEVEVRFTAQPRAASPFQAQRVDDTSPPAVTVTNDSDRAMTLTLDAQVFSIAPRSKQTITLQPGRLSYVASAPGVIPAMGTQEFARGHVYTWRFWIER